jgi:hypothetical protein
VRALAQEIWSPALWSITSLEGHGVGIVELQDREDKSVQRLCTQQACQDCFPSSEHRLRGILDLIHSDVCGPMSSTSLTSNIYYVSFIDDSSRKTWIYFMKTKDEVFNRFQEFKALVEN